MYVRASQEASRAVQLQRDFELEQGKTKKEGSSAGGSIAQLQAMAGNQAVMQLLNANAAIQRKSGNGTGMPDHLKSGLEELSGMDLSDVNVHYNSSKPAELNALAYAQGTDIHVGPGQEEHLPHEGWHIVQQKQGRVQPTATVEGAAINDDAALEAEADRMGAKALQMKTAPAGSRTRQLKADASASGAQALQRKVIQRQQTEIYVKNIKGSYTDNSGSHEIDYPTDTYITKTNSHPRGKVDYDDQVKKMLKKNNVVPKTVPDDQITITYDQYGKKK